MVVQKIESKEAFETLVKEKPIVLVDAFATWCGPCRAIAPQLEKWSEQYASTITFAKFDIDDLGPLTQELGITSVPTFLIFTNGEKEKSIVGANPATLMKTLKDLSVAAEKKEEKPEGSA